MPPPHTPHSESRSDRPPRSPAFPETRWSRILAAPGQRDLDELARTYWRPIRAWLRARLRLSCDAAADLAQEAFAWMLSTGFLDRADPSRGRFRGFLKTALANFAIERARHAGAQKRGGGTRLEPLGDAGDVVDASSPTPDQVLDLEWRRELLERARDELQQELEGSGRATHFALFRDYFLADEDVDHRQLAERHGITRTDVSNWLDHAKRRYRARLRALVRDTVDDEDALREELAWLFGSDRGADGARR